MTKSFTAAAVLALRDDEVLDLDAPIARLAPSLAGVVGPTSDAPPVTLRLLLTMSAGFATDDPWADRLLDAEPTVMDDLFERGAHHAHPTATAFQYSNYGFAMAGRVVEEVPGAPLRDHVSARLLEPLGMTDTGWDPPDVGAATGHRWLAPIHDGDEGAWQAELPPLADGGVAPMGGLWSSIEDLRRWVRFMLDAYPARNDPDDGPLRRSSRREQQQIHRSHGNPGMASGYGMGLQVVHDEQLGTVVTHSGGLPGFGSNMRWLVDHGLGIVALSNLTYAPMAQLNMAIFDRLPSLAGNAPLTVPPPSAPQVEAAHRFLIRVLEPILGDEPPDWSVDSSDSGWAINVELDEPFDRRAALIARDLARLRRGLDTLSGNEVTFRFGPLSIQHGAAGSFTIEPVERVVPTAARGHRSKIGAPPRTSRWPSPSAPSPHPKCNPSPSARPTARLPTPLLATRPVIRAVDESGHQVSIMGRFLP
ncbi:MAG: serine hydrolase domain-containing protein [Acidimicrobiales bacterium]